MYDFEALKRLNKEEERRLRQQKKQVAKRRAKLDADLKERRTDDEPYLPYANGGYEP